MNISICDDNTNDVLLLKRCIKEYFASKNLIIKIDCFYSSNTLLNTPVRYDIVFLDIEMPEIDGIKLGRLLKEKDYRTKIIYVSGHSSYLYEAFQIHAYMYITKPFDSKLVFKTLDDCITENESQNAKNLVTFSIDGEKIELDIRCIIYFEYTNRKIKITTNNDMYYFYGILKNVYKKVQQFNIGMCHNAFLVNFLYIEKIKGYTLYLKNKESIPISQRKMKQFRSDYYNFLKKAYLIIK